MMMISYIRFKQHIIMFKLCLPFLNLDFIREINVWWQTQSIIYTNPKMVIKIMKLEEKLCYCFVFKIATKKKKKKTLRFGVFVLLLFFFLFAVGFGASEANIHKLWSDRFNYGSDCRTTKARSNRWWNIFVYYW